jgi:hypothetical protein
VGLLSSPMSGPSQMRKERTFADGLRMVWNEPQRAQDIACPAIVLEAQSGERRSDTSGPQREALAREEHAQATSGLAARGEDLSDVMRGSRVPRPSLRNKWKVFSTRLACQREMRPRWARLQPRDGRKLETQLFPVGGHCGRGPITDGPKKMTLGLA